jgi:hypothetical protein
MDAAWLSRAESDSGEVPDQVDSPDRVKMLYSNKGLETLP